MKLRTTLTGVRRSRATSLQAGQFFIADSRICFKVEREQDRVEMVSFEAAASREAFTLSAVPDVLCTSIDLKDFEIVVPGNPARAIGGDLPRGSFCVGDSGLLLIVELSGRWGDSTRFAIDLSTGKSVAIVRDQLYPLFASWVLSARVGDADERSEIAAHNPQEG